MSTIRVRRLDENWDPCFGNGQNDYVFDGEAVAQIIESRLRLWLQEWWEDQDEGLPMFQKILGKMGSSQAIADRLIQKRILETPYVTGLVSFESSFDISTRAYICSAYVNTEFGTITVTNGGSGSDVTRRGFCYMEGTSGDPDANGTTLYAGKVVGTPSSNPVALKAFTAVNCTGLTKANGVLKIDIKCDAPEKLSSSLGRQIELTSSGKADTNEWSIVPPLSEITASYKTFYLPLSGATTTGGELDVTAINFIRIYAYSTDSSNITLSWRNAAILIG